MSGNTVVVSSRRFTQVSTAHFLAKSDSLMGVSEIIWCPVIVSRCEGKKGICLSLALTLSRVLFVGSAFDMYTDSKRSCSQRVGGTIGYGSWISILQPLDYLTRGFCD